MSNLESIEDIVHLIGEAKPYAFIPETVLDDTHSEVKIEVSQVNFRYENFTDLLKMLSSLGSLNLYKLTNNKTRNKVYFLGEKLKIQKIAYEELEEVLLLECKSYTESKRKGKSYIVVRNKSSEQIIYSFVLDYYILNKESFEEIYKQHYSPEFIEGLTEESVLPRMKVRKESDQSISILIDEFKKKHCLGHFDYYPIVPAVVMAKCILKEISSFFKIESYEIDSLEMYLSKAMPINRCFRVEVVYKHLVKNYTSFTCIVKDHSDKDYGMYVIGMKYK